MPKVARVVSRSAANPLGIPCARPSSEIATIESQPKEVISLLRAPGVVTVGGREISENFYSYFLDRLSRVPLS